MTKELVPALATTETPARRSGISIKPFAAVMHLRFYIFFRLRWPKRIFGAARARSDRQIAKDVKPSPSIKKNVLLLCLDSSWISYKVLRCAHAAGATVFVLGNKKSLILPLILRTSRYCRKFIAFAYGGEQQDNTQLIYALNQYTREYHISCIVPTDRVSTRVLASVRTTLNTFCFPLATDEQFALLNDKSRFIKLCNQLVISCPDSLLLQDRHELLVKLNDGALALPLVVKPVSAEGGHNVFAISQSNIDKVIPMITFSPVLVQTLIEGRQVCATVYCRFGSILSICCYSFFRRVYSTFVSKTICDAITKIAKHLHLSGVYNFDLIVAKSGKAYFLECNARFDSDIHLAMLSGYNFVMSGLCSAQTEKPLGCDIAKPMRLTLNIYKPWQWTAQDIRTFAFFARDPLPYLVRKLWKLWHAIRCFCVRRSAKPVTRSMRSHEEWCLAAGIDVP